MINSLARGLEALRILAQADGPLGVTDLATKLGVDPSSSYRILATLESYGFVVQEPRGRKYTLGFETLAIAGAVLRRLDVVALAGKHLLDLVARTGESAHLAVLNGTSAIFVGREAAAAPLRVETRVGASEPAYCTAIGKALLFDHDTHDLRALFDDVAFQRYTARTVASVDDLVEDIARSRARSYAFDDQEFHDGVRCLAAPLREYGGKIVAAIGISGPSTRLSHAHLPALAAIVREVAESLSEEMGAPRHVPAGGRAAL